MGALSALAMAPTYIWPLMLCGYSTLLYITITKASGFRQAALYGFLFFLGYFLVGLYWTSSSLFVDFDQWWWALPFSFFGLPTLLAILMAVPLGLTGFCKAYRALAVVTALIVADLARSTLFTGFPWNLPVHTWAHTEMMMRLLPLTGLYLLNALTIILFTLPAITALYAGQYKRYAAITLAAIYLLIGIYQMPRQENNIGLPDNVIMVQANIPQKEKWDSRYIERNLKRYIDMSSEEIEQKDRPVIIIWPETAISQTLLSYPHLQRQFYDFLESLPEKSYLVTGYLYHTDEGYFNSLAVLDKKGTIESIYNKHHLVPFGEYMPLGIDTLTGVSNFKSGPIPSTIYVEDRKLEFLPLICYEIIFPSYANKSTENSIILNITNDSWFGKTAGPYQHFDQAIFRARETGKPVLRLASNGISGIILPNGDVLQKTKINTYAIIKTH